MLVTSTQLVLHTTHSLRAENVPAEQADAGIGQFLLRIRASSPVGFLDQTVIVLRQTHKLEDCGV